VAKDHCAGHDGFSDIMSLKLPCVARRARAGANSGIHALQHARLSRALDSATRRHATALLIASPPAIHGLRRSSPEA